MERKKEFKTQVDKIHLELMRNINRITDLSQHFVALYLIPLYKTIKKSFYERY